jgi:DNA-binding NarL/FixJ family response regulator
MPRKRFKKYEQSVSAPYFQPTSGSQVAQTLQAVIAKLFGKAREVAPTREEIIHYHLTPREREIAYLAALGFSDKEIADALAMNFQTVRVHLRNLLDKLQLNDVTELRAYFSPQDRP